nr:MAG TPA: hypothetical protein [Caudoviricetes sp.]
MLLNIYILILKRYISDGNKPMGLTGFDSEMKWFVSMQCIVGWHYNLRRQIFNWRRKLRSCCLIES